MKFVRKLKTPDPFAPVRRWVWDLVFIAILLYGVFLAVGA